MPTLNSFLFNTTATIIIFASAMPDAFYLSLIHICIEQWNEKVDNAKSSMEGFNDSILMSQEEQQNLTDEMDAIFFVFVKIRHFLPAKRQVS